MLCPVIIWFICSISESQRAIEEITGRKPLGYTVDLLDKNSVEEVFKKVKPLHCTLLCFPCFYDTEEDDI